MSERADPTGPTVVHYREDWLRVTEGWIRTQALHAADAGIPTVVACDWRTGGDETAVPALHVLPRRPQCRRRAKHWLRKLTNYELFGAPGLAALVRLRGARIVHAHFGRDAYAAARRLQRAGLDDVRLVVTFYGWDVDKIPTRWPRWQRRYAALFARADRVLCEGPHMAGRLAARGCPESKLRVQHLGIDLQAHPYRPRECPEPGEPLRILMAASFSEKKGLPFGLAAIGRLQRDMPVEVTLIGDGGGEERRRIDAAIAEGGLAERVRRLGYVPPATLLAEAYRHHVFLQPSVTATDGDTEGGAPVTLAQMAATGMPIVASRHADIPHVVPHERVSRLAGERDVTDIQAQLLWWVKQPEQWRGMLDAGRARVEAEFDARRQGERLAAVYRELVGA